MKDFGGQLTSLASKGVSQIGDGMKAAGDGIKAAGDGIIAAANIGQPKSALNKALQSQRGQKESKEAERIRLKREINSLINRLFVT